MLGYSPWGPKESDTDERLTHTHTHTEGSLSEKYWAALTSLMEVDDLKLMLQKSWVEHSCRQARYSHNAMPDRLL